MLRFVGLSSTASTRCPQSWNGSVSVSTVAAACFSSVSSNQNVLPLPGSLSSQMRPPMSSISCRVIVSPSPVPPYRRVVLPSAWVKLSNTAACCSTGMPIPVS